MSSNKLLQFTKLQIGLPVYLSSIRYNGLMQYNTALL